MRAATAVGALALVAGCTGGEEQAAPPGPIGGPEEAPAQLTVIDAQIGVKRAGDTSFAPGASGDDLDVGDQVRADTTGFGEITYFDGSWMRIEAEATLAIDELADTEEGQVVETSIDDGRLWARAEELTESGDRFAVGTPVGTASVRGTRFSVDCTVTWAEALTATTGTPPEDVTEPDQVCSFTVIEGEVTVEGADGTTHVLGPATRLWVASDDREALGPESVVPDALHRDPWVAKNLGIDAARPGTRAPDPGTAGKEAAATLARTWEAAVRVTTSTDPRVREGSEDTARWQVTIRCDGGPCRGERRMVDAAGRPALRDGAGREVVDEVVALGAGRYRITATWTDSCQRDGTVLADAGTRVTRVGEYEVTDVSFVGGRWTATELEGTVTTTTELTTAGRQADCTLPGQASSVAFTTEVTAGAA